MNAFQWLRHSTPVAGVYKVNHDPTVAEAPPPEVPQLAGLVQLLRPVATADPAAAAAAFKALFMKTCVLLHVFRPAAAGPADAAAYYRLLEDAYTRRLELLLGRRGVAAIGAGLAPANAAVVVAYAATDIAFNPAVFARFVDGAASFNAHDITVRASSLGSLTRAVEAVVRCLFLSTFGHNVYAMMPSEGVPLPWL